MHAFHVMLSLRHRVWWTQAFSSSDRVFYKISWRQVWQEEGCSRHGVCDDILCTTFVGLLLIPRHKVLGEVTAVNGGEQRSTVVNDIEAKTKDLDS